MSKIIFDIETVGDDFDSFDQKSQEYLMKFAESEEEKLEVKQRLALYPLTSQVVAIGMLNPDTDKGVCYFQTAGGKIVDFEADGVLYKSGSEVEILRYFWDNIKKYDQFITFNGRGFDCPFLMIRSAMLGVKCSRSLMPYRYSSDVHIDLLEQLTFQSAVKKFSLDFYCKQFKIKSPKSDGIDGLMVPELFRSGEFEKIAKYCVGDVIATKELWQRWDKLMRV